MASYYVRSGAGGAGTGADWANAYTALGTAVSGKAAGDVFYVSEDHTETVAGSTITFPGTDASPNLIYCVNHSGTVPPVDADLRTTAAMTTTVNNSFTWSGTFYCYGMAFTIGASTGSPSFIACATAGDNQSYESCSFTMGSTGGTKVSVSQSTAGGALVRFVNCTFTFSGTAQSISVFANTVLRGCTMAGSTLPTNLFLVTANRAACLLCEGCDFSVIGSGKNLVDATTASTFPVVIRDSKINASVTPVSVQTKNGYPTLDLVNCDSGSVNYRVERSRYTGLMTTEATIVRTGGASNGVTTFSWKIVTTANPEWVQPFESPPIVVWNDTTGSAVTATVEGIWGGGAVPNNDDIWIDAMYLGSSASPRTTLITGGKASGLATNAALSSSSEAWGGSTTAFKMQVTFTPQMKGWVYITVKAAKVSTTFYVDPKVTLT